MLIDETYFVGELNIPNADSEETLPLFIEKYEKLFLREVMGYETYNAYIAAPTDPIWVAFVEGASYTFGGMGYQWENLKQAIACYVYFHWMRNEASQTTQLGEAKAQAQNAVNASPLYKMVRAWNEMVDIVWNMWWYLDSSLDIYTTWKNHYPSHWTRSNFRKINSLGI